MVIKTNQISYSSYSKHLRTFESVPVIKELLTGTVPVNKKLLTGTVLVNNLFLKIYLIVHHYLFINKWLRQTICLNCVNFIIFQIELKMRHLDKAQFFHHADLPNIFIWEGWSRSWFLSATKACKLFLLNFIKRYFKCWPVTVLKLLEKEFSPTESQYIFPSVKNKFGTGERDSRSLVYVE